MKLSSTKLKVFGGWIVVLMCIMAFSSKVLGSESIPVSYTHLTLPTTERV